MATEGGRKVIFTGLLCAIVGILGSALFFYHQHQEASRNFTHLADELRQQLSALEQERASVQQALITVTADKAALTGKLDALTAQLDTVNKQLTQAQTEAQTTAAQLATAKAERAALQAQVDALTAEQDQLKKQVARAGEDKAALTKTLNTLQDKVAAVEEEKRTLAADLEQVRERLARAEATSPALLGTAASDLTGEPQHQKGGASPPSASVIPKEAIELPPIVVYRGEPLTTLDLPEGAVSARVIAVNSEQRFLIVDKGSGQGLFLGSVLQVYRKGQLIAKIKAVRVREALSACDILPTDTGQAPNVGDLAVLVKE